MKKCSLKRMLTALLLTIALTFGSVGAFIGCGSPSDPPDPPAATLEDIELDTSAVKTTFAFAETFTYDGLKVKAVMSDDSKKDVPLTDCKVSEPNMELEGKRNVTVTYSGKTARYAITVNPRVFPEITGDPLLTIAAENASKAFRVEAEDIDMTGVVKANGVTSFVADAPVEPESPAPEAPEATADEGTDGDGEQPGDGDGSEAPTYGITSGGKYLTGFGVRFNYFGFKIEAAQEFTGVTMVMRLANSSESNIQNLGETVNIFLNRSVNEDGDVEGLLESTATIDAGLCDWRDIVIRNLTLKEGDNYFTIDVLGSQVPDIDYIDFYVGMRYISTVFEFSETGEKFVDLEDFDTEKAGTRPDWAAAHPDKIVNGLGLEPVTRESEGKTTSRGTSIAALMGGSELSTTLRLAQNSTVKLSFKAAKVDSYFVDTNWDFSIDGYKLKFVEHLDIKGGNPGAGMYWDWFETDLGTYNIPAGDHLFTVKNTGSDCNIDGINFEILAVGEYDESGIPLDDQDTYLPHNCSNVCMYCDGCTDPECEREECANKCTSQHVVMEAEALDGSTAVKRDDFGGGNGFNIGSNNAASGGQSTYAFTKGSIFAVKLTVTEACTIDIWVRLYSDKTETFAENFVFKMDGAALTQANPDAVMTPNQQWHNVCVAKGVTLAEGEHVFVMEVVANHFDFDCISFNASTGTTTPLTVAAMVYTPEATEPEQPSTPVDPEA